MTLFASFTGISRISAWRFETTSTLSVPEMGPVTVRRFLDSFAGWGHSVHNGDHVFSAGQEFDAGDSEDGNGGGDYDLFSSLGFWVSFLWFRSSMGVQFFVEFFW